MKTNNNVILHGECMAFESTIPTNAQRLNVRDFLIVADSETTGNHHVVDNAEGCEFYQLDGIRYMKNSKPTKIRCLHTDRHDALELSPGQWEFGTQQEYDPFLENMRNVRD